MSTPVTTPPPQGRRMVAVAVLVSALAALALWAFAWPAARTAPRDLPLGVAGPAAATAPLQAQLKEKDGAFEIHRYADEAEARDAIEDRAVYGAIVATPQGMKLLTATAASPVVAQLLEQAVAGQAPEGSRVTTTDVVSAPAADPRGAALGAGVLPLAIAGVAAGAIVTVLGLRGIRAVASLVLGAALVGTVAAALTHSWLGVLTGNWWAEAGVLSLSTLAVGATVAGCAALLGPAGIGVGALVMVLIGNPFSGVTSAPQLLPEPVGFIGQLLPPGAGGTLLRSVSFFDGARVTTPLITLTVWGLLGLTAVLLGTLRRRPAPARDEAPATRETVPAP
ncbi:membrane protein [Streptomyces longisporoflavus]|uniref:ABC transporter permease n=1 Tax=Streptomyces longisporoflavus TaxID=28044 RepID=UPI00167D914C|nr:ABC transporter permease [Streptomyces longisporoflavus]GGV22176.1 membrane protein [Streptomyces longisporoflavus]